MNQASEIAGYELQEVLGGGAQTVVHAARCLETGASCVIKIIRRRWEGHPGALKRMRREARVLLGVQHPNLVHLEHAYVVRPPYHLVLSRVEGETLRKLLGRDGPVAPDRAMTLTRQLAEAVILLLRGGFVHGCIRPENILVHEDKAVLIDMGLARRTAEGMHLESGTPLAPPSYLAPELCQLEPMDHPRSDMFSLGSTFYEMLTGHVPYPAATLDEARRPERFERAAPSTDIPAALEPILARLLSRDPKQRPHPQRLVNELVLLREAAPLRHAS